MEISTKKIYRIVFNRPKNISSPLAGKYHLRGIMELGLSGYPFKRFINEILKQQGHAVIMSEIVKDNSVNHEIDTIAEKNSPPFMIECKYPHQPGTRSHMKIPLLYPVIYITTLTKIEKQQLLEKILCYAKKLAMAKNNLNTILD